MGCLILHMAHSLIYCFVIAIRKNLLTSYGDMKIWFIVRDLTMGSLSKR